VLEPDPDTCELVLTQIHPGVEVDKVRVQTGWDLRVADPLETTEPPTGEELSALRELVER
jgi:glutaconate CoA-transferase, subunit B